MNNVLKNINLNKLAILAASAITMLIVAYEPRLQSAEAEIISALTFIAVALIAGDSLDNIARAWLSQPGNVDRTVKGAQGLIDYAESTFRIDIPDSMEAAAVQELRERLQAVVDKTNAIAPDVTAPPVQLSTTVKPDVGVTGL